MRDPESPHSSGKTVAAARCGFRFVSNIRPSSATGIPAIGCGIQATLTVTTTESPGPRLLGRASLARPVSLATLPATVDSSGSRYCLASAASLSALRASAFMALSKAATAAFCVSVAGSHALAT